MAFFIALLYRKCHCYRSLFKCSKKVSKRYSLILITIFTSGLTYDDQLATSFRPVGGCYRIFFVLPSCGPLYPCLYSCGDYGIMCFLVGARTCAYSCNLIDPPGSFALIRCAYVKPSCPGLWASNYFAFNGWVYFIDSNGAQWCA